MTPVGRKPHPVWKADLIEKLDAASIGIEAKQAAVSPHRAGKDPALWIGDHVIEPVVAGMQVSSDFLLSAIWLKY